MALHSIATTVAGPGEHMVINPKVLAWFEERGISKGNLEAMNVYSGQQVSIGSPPESKVVPSETGEIIVFPYMLGTEPVNHKYRGRGKTFFQDAGGQKILYNVNVLDDPQLTEGRFPLTIVEGEIDLLSALEAGNPFVVSVPDGAPPAHGKPVDIDAFDPEHDVKYQYIVREWEKLKKIKRLIIAVDNDGPGLRLAEELVRRLGRDRCSFVTYPEGCKDFNDVLLKHGPAKISELIATAKPYPVSGVYKYSDLPPEPPLVPVTTGWARLDDFLMVYYPAFMVITGLAGSGKSTLANQMVGQLALKHGWRIAIASFEMRIKPFISDTLINVYCNNTSGDVDDAEQWIDDHFTFIAPEPSDDDDRFNIDWLIERATTAAIRYGARVLLIDPWNEIEHASRTRESTTEYTGRAIRALKRFGREFECLVIVVAHPTKYGAAKEASDVNLYDISDSAHWSNKADLGVVVARLAGSYVSEIFVKKIRYQPVTGQLGSIMLTYDPKLRMFSQ